MEVSDDAVRAATEGVQFSAKFSASVVDSPNEVGCLCLCLCLCLCFEERIYLLGLFVVCLFV
jgi:hypothetical protein